MKKLDSEKRKGIIMIIMFKPKDDEKIEEMKRTKKSDFQPLAG